MMYGLDLFSGIGGLALGLQEWVRPVAYCEIDPFARGVLFSRMAEGRLPRAPVWDDVRTLRGSDIPPIDIIYGGFPCQDISIAGNRAGLDGERSGLYREIIRIVGEIRPTFVFLENVAAIRSNAWRVIQDLAGLGFNCRWTALSASEVGAPHKRNRWWLLAANTNSLDIRQQSGRIKRENGQDSLQPRINGQKESLGDADSVRKLQLQLQGLKLNQRGRTSHPNWWAVEPDVGRVAHGIPKRVDRLRGLGNAVVPMQAHKAFQYLVGPS